MGFVLVILVVAIGGAGYWYWSRKRGNPSVRPAVVSHSPQAAEPERRPGRMINPGADCCAAIRRIESAWYPEGKIPRLPLETCDHPETCKCAWMRVVDRRTTHRRTDHDRREQMRFEDKSDRRAGRDRRGDAGNPWKNT
jgi:hypothetical protein